MKKIYLILNYKGAFGNKYKADPYHSGMNKDQLEKYFNAHEYEPIFISPASIDFRDSMYNDALVLYTSTEDPNGYYKDFIEDIILGLETKGATVIPSYKHLRAHHNKVFMEILRDIVQVKELKTIKSKKFGTYEEFLEYGQDDIRRTLVIKESSGASSFGVYKGTGPKETKSLIRRIAKVSNLKEDFKEFVRATKHSGYKKISRYRKKFVTQNFIPDLQNDWKILIYGEKYFSFYRPVRKNDFRASGSGKEKYLFGSDSKLPTGILDLCRKIFLNLKVPFLSLDIACSNNQFHCIEFQFTAFGTSGVQLSKDYYSLEDGEWKIFTNDKDVERVYVDSIVSYLNSEFQTS